MLFSRDEVALLQAQLTKHYYSPTMNCGTYDLHVIIVVEFDNKYVVVLTIV